MWVPSFVVIVLIAVLLYCSLPKTAREVECLRKVGQGQCTAREEFGRWPDDVSIPCGGVF
jgi:hypothetical protein